jgi:hypothetical protein
MNERDAKTVAAACGLQFVDCRMGTKHRLLRFSRPNDGAVLQVAVSINGAGSCRDVLNMKGQMRRFARGQNHGLKVEGVN